MGTNLHSAYVDGVTCFRATDINGPLSDLDKAITYLKNIVITCDGLITYNGGTITWASTMHLYFTTAAGVICHNSIATGNVSLSDNYAAYVTLNETNNTVLTVSTAAMTAGGASPVITYNRVMLGYRNTNNDLLFGALKNIVTQNATLATAGIIELATNAETLTGTDTTRAVTPDDLKYGLNNGLDFGATSPGKFYPKKFVQAAVPNAGTAATQISAGEFCIWVRSATAATVNLCYNLGGVIKTSVMT